MCGFKNGEFPIRATWRSYQISLLLCYWDSRANEEHWVRKEWPPRNKIKPGEKNNNNPLVDRKNIIFPPLHIKLGLMKQFVKALDRF